MAMYEVIHFFAVSLFRILEATQQLYKASTYEIILSEIREQQYWYACAKIILTE